jgi:dihydrofolate reductase
MISIDGYIAGPNGELDWIFRTVTDELQRWIVESTGEVDTILIGRKTYEEMAADFGDESGGFASPMNDISKIVFSRTLTSVGWKNCRLAEGGPAEEIAKLKQQPGKNISVLGGAALARSLAAQGLIDEYSLVTHPVALGSGVALFDELTNSLALQLIDTITFDTGVVVHRYQPA